MRTPRPHSARLETLEPRRLLAGTTLGVLVDEFVYNDADGDQVTIRLRGKGTADITLVGGAADLADCDAIVFHDTDASTKLEIKVKKGRLAGDGTTRVQSITGDTVGALTLKGATLAGDGVNLTGSLGSFVANGFANGADLLLGAGARPLKLELVELEGDGANDVTIQTPGAIAQLRVREPASGFVIQTGGDLTNVKFEKGVTGGTLSVGGDVKSLEFKAGAEDITANVGGKLSKLLLTGDGSGLRVSVADALTEWTVKKGKAQAGSLTDTRVNVGGAMRKVNVAGDVSDTIFAAAGGMSDLVFGADVADTLVLAGATLAGDLEMAGATFAVASIRTVTIKGDFEDAVIAAGGDPGADSLFAANEVLAGGKIERLKIGGIIRAVDSPHPNPGIYAEELGPVAFEGRVGPAVIG